MPDYFSHYVLAEKIYEKLGGDHKEKIKSKPLYLMGAQGGDVFFAYSVKLTKNNLGRNLHSRSATEIFNRLAMGNRVYAAGFASHYAVDCTLHPTVYSYEDRHRSPFAHQRFESDLGLFISKFYGVRRAILPRERVIACTGAIYDSIRLIESSVTVTGVERCLKRFFNYTRYLYGIKKQSYKCDFDFASMAGLLDEAIDLGVQAVSCMLEGNADGEIFSKEFLQR